MDMAPEGLIEEKSRPKVLVIEDNPEFLGNALTALRDFEAVPAMDLEQARRAIATASPDYILSDVHFPDKAGDEPRANVKAILEEAYDRGIPVCFVTKADHHGLLDLGDEGHVSLKAVTLGDIASTRMEIGRSGEEPDERQLFRKMKATESRNLRASEKTIEVWSTALDILRNAATKPNPLGGAIAQVRKTLGVDVGFKGGVPKLIPPKK